MSTRVDSGHHGSPYLAVIVAFSCGHFNFIPLNHETLLRAEPKIRPSNAAGVQLHCVSTQTNVRSSGDAESQADNLSHTSFFIFLHCRSLLSSTVTVSSSRASSGVSSGFSITNTNRSDQVGFVCFVSCSSTSCQDHWLRENRDPGQPFIVFKEKNIYINNS